MLLIVDGVEGSWLVVVGVGDPCLELDIVGLDLPSSSLSSKPPSCDGDFSLANFFSRYCIDYYVEV
jgi:hypothetical protein